MNSIVGERRVPSQAGLAQGGPELARRLRHREEALSHSQPRPRLVSVCSYCNKIRDDHNRWHWSESNLKDHAGAEFTHGICPDCFARWRQDFGL